MKLSMIVVITSCAPVFALSQPGMKPQIAPPIDAGDDRERQVDEPAAGR